MKTIIAGSRTINESHKDKVFKIFDTCPWQITEVICGCAKGVDTLGEDWAKSKGIPVRRFPADWSIGKSAGVIRNSNMVNYGEASLIVWDGVSRGTFDTINKSWKKGYKSIHVCILNDKSEIIELTLAQLINCIKSKKFVKLDPDKELFENPTIM